MRFHALAAAMAVALASDPAPAEIVIGAAIPLNGRHAEQGQAIRLGLESAVAAANKAGGVRGEPLKLTVVDDGCEAAKGAEAARALVAAKVAVVIGHPCGSAAVTAARIYAESKTTLLALTRHPELTDKRAGPTIFRYAGRDDRQGMVIAGHIAASIDPKSAVLVHDRTTYGREIAEAVEKGLAERGIKALFSEGIVAGDKDFGPLVQRIKQAAATTVVFGGFPAEAAILRAQMQAAGHTATLIGGDALASREFADVAGPAADGVLVALPSAEDLPITQAGAAQAAAALALWLRAARQAAGGTTTEEIALLTRTQGLPERLFQANGDLSTPSYGLRRWQSGALRPLDR